MGGYEIDMAIMVSVILMCVGVFMFAIGYHNSDLGWNIVKLNIISGYENCNMVITGDTGNDAFGNQIFLTPDQMITKGNHMMDIGLLALGLGSIVFGYALGKKKSVYI